MKNLSIVVCLLCLFVAAPTMADYYGGTVNYTQLSNYSAGQGGEFSIEPDDVLTLSNSAYAGSTKGKTSSGSFQSFCLEVGEHIYDNLHVKVSETYKDGTTPGSHAYAGGEGDGDDLNTETAWLYTQFATGQLTDYAYTGTVDGLNRSETAGALQRLIWSMEGEGGGSGWSVNETLYYGVEIEDDQLDLIDLWETEFKNDTGWSGIGNVRVLQLYGSYLNDEYSCFRQDQLYLVPVPGAILLGILGLSAAGLKLRRFA